MICREALDKGLCESSLTQFYYVARMILVKSETEFDKFDMAFEECFKGVKTETEVGKNMLRWLDKSDMMELAHEEARKHLNQVEEIQVDKDDVEEKFKQRLKDQNEEHNGKLLDWHHGKKRPLAIWAAMSAACARRRTDRLPVGILRGREARKYRDFRDDKVIDNRQFQMALRRLRQFSTKLDLPKSELDIDQTIDKTCNNGGYLQIEMMKPRKNAVKLLLLIRFRRNDDSVYEIDERFVSVS